jgi:hypothetical protein
MPSEGEASAPEVGVDFGMLEGCPFMHPESNDNEKMMKKNIRYFIL